MPAHPDPTAPARGEAAGAPVHVIGASGRSGQALCRALALDGIPYVAVARDAARFAATGLAGPPRQADLGAPRALRAALADAVRIVSCAHARHTASLLAAAPAEARLVLLGSTRKFTRWPDAHGEGVRAGEAAFLASGRSGVMLHPTMIYGAQGEDNVRRLARLARRLPLLPLPGGGRALVQPIFQGDVTRALRSALDVAWKGPHTLVIAGPDPLPYAAFLRAVARAAGVTPPPVLPVPAAPLMALAPLSRLLPGLPVVRAAEIRRLLEDKAFDIAPMTAALGLRPVPLAEGLAATFA